MSEQAGEMVVVTRRLTTTTRVAEMAAPLDVAAWVEAYVARVLELEHIGAVPVPLTRFSRLSDAS